MNNRRRITLDKFPPIIFVIIKPKDIFMDNKPAANYHLGMGLSKIDRYIIYDILFKKLEIRGCL